MVTIKLFTLIIISFSSTFCCNLIRSNESQDWQREIILQELKRDTLEVVSTARELFFPFGSFTAPSELLSKHPLVLASKFINKNSKTIYLYTFGRNTFRFVLTEDWYDDRIKMMIVNAEILDNKIKLWDNISIGMSKKELINFFCDTVSQEQIDKINFLSLISGVEGIRYHYTFYDNKLISIIIESDYSIDFRD